MRIEAGQYKGRKILGRPKEATARPITGRVRRSVFGTLGERLIAAAVADLYCGTGTLGLEALSRGASRCWFAERDRATLQRLRRNIEDLGAGEVATVWAGDVTRRLGAGRTAGLLAAVSAPGRRRAARPADRQPGRAARDAGGDGGDGHQAAW